MWFKKKEIPELIKTPPPMENKEPATREAIMELVLVNSRTDKVYCIYSENDLGLYLDSSDNVLYAYQITNLEIFKKRYKARFVDFSLVNVVYKKFPA